MVTCPGAQSTGSSKFPSAFPIHTSAKITKIRRQNINYILDTPLCHVTYNTALMQSLKAKLTQITRAAALELSPTLPCSSAHFPDITLAPTLPTAKKPGKWWVETSVIIQNEGMFCYSPFFAICLFQSSSYEIWIVLGTALVFSLPPELWHGRESTGSWAACGFSQHKKKSMCLYLEVEKGTIAFRKKGNKSYWFYLQKSICVFGLFKSKMCCKRLTLYPATIKSFLS